MLLIHSAFENQITGLSKLEYSMACFGVET